VSSPQNDAPVEGRPRPTRRNGQLSPVLRGLLVRFQFVNLLDRYDGTKLTAIFSFINGCLSIAIMSVAALLSHEPFIFPSLGPTAFLFFYSPLAPVASPRNAFIGHLIGAIAGLGSLLVFGLQGDPPAIATSVTAARVGAAALSLGLTSGLMILARSPHPPAGATTLIISLGIMRTLEQIVVLMIAVVLLTLQAIVINRLAGLPYPLWAAKPPPVASNPEPSAGAEAQKQ
jgi:CBS-domain-containing membrane protein